MNRSPARRFGIAAVILLSVLTLVLPTPAYAAESLTDDPPPVPQALVVGALNAPVELLTAGHGDVLRLYWAFFNREPDRPGAAYWKAQFDSGLSIERMAAAFAASDEYQAKYAGITTNAQFVERVYNNTLQRQPDQSGWIYWTGLMDRGELSNIEVVLHFAKSFEFVANHPYGNRANVSGGPALAGMDFLEALLADRPQPRAPVIQTSDFKKPLKWIRASFGPNSVVQFADSCTELDSETTACRYLLTSPDEAVGARHVEVRVTNNEITGASWPRTTVAQSYRQYATVAAIPLFLPSAKVERIGFHESGHDGSQQATVVDSGVPVMTLESRGRGTGSRTAADISVERGSEIRSPVTGTVVRAGTYTLYCRHKDHYLVVEPDAQPGWEVKMFHFEGLRVSKGDRVIAGSTTVGSQGRVLPFESQIDKFNASPSNPHVHVEVVDPSIPDRPSKGGGC